MRDRVRIDARIAAEVLLALEKKGHQLERAVPWRGPGTLEAFTIDPVTGVIMAGYDPKGGSIAIGW